MSIRIKGNPSDFEKFSYCELEDFPYICLYEVSHLLHSFMVTCPAVITRIFTSNAFFGTEGYILGCQKSLAEFSLVVAAIA